MNKVPDNVMDKELYLKIKMEIAKSLKTRWSAYASGLLVKKYKEKGGRYSDKKKDDEGIGRWFKEEWINICKSDPPKKIVRCGRKKENEEYPVCRPYKRINEKTPTTFEEMNKKEIKKICQEKKKDPTKKLSSFKKK